MPIILPTILPPPTCPVRGSLPSELKHEREGTDQIVGLQLFHECTAGPKLSPIPPGRAALPVAMLASAVIPFTTHDAHTTSRVMHRVSRIAYPVLTAVLVLAAFPHPSPPQGYCSSAPYPAIIDVFAYEHQSKLVGVDPEGSYFPAWVQRRPTGSPLEEQYIAGGQISRLDDWRISHCHRTHLR